MTVVTVWACVATLPYKGEKHPCAVPSLTLIGVYNCHDYAPRAGACVPRMVIPLFIDECDFSVGMIKVLFAFWLVSLA